jgi:hypothetical protein
LEFPNSDDAEMIAAVEMALAEVADGLIDEREARSSLQEVLERIGTTVNNTVNAPVAADGYVTSIVTGSRSQVLTKPVAGFNLVVSFASQ